MNWVQEYPCAHGHAWVPVYRWRWSGWRPRKYVYEACWDCPAERHRGRTTLPI